MFIQKVIISNLLVYYGVLEVDFTYIPNKNIYCIYGDNSHGKTSFIACVKLLFLGSGLLEENDKIPENIERLTKNIKVNSPRALMEGCKNWTGIFNKAAKSERKKEYFVEFQGIINNEKFILRREWEVSFQHNTIFEYLKFDIGNRIYENESAQNEINKILSPNFVDFFFFNGEEIESMSENLRTSLKEKINAILQITPLDVIIKQINNLKNDLRSSQIENLEIKNKYEERHKELETLSIKLENTENEINNLENFINEKSEECANKEAEIRKLIANQSQIHKELESKRKEIEKDIEKNKNELPHLLQSVVFVANTALLDKLKQEIINLDSKANRGDIDALERLLPHIKTLLSKKFGNSNYIVREFYETFATSLDSMPVELQEHLHDSMLPLNVIKDIEDTILRLENNKLAQNITAIKCDKTRLQNIKDEIKELNLDDSTKAKEENLKSEIAHIQSQISDLKLDQDSKKEKRGIIKRDIETKEHEINSIKQSINTERIDYKLNMLDKLKYYIQTYKDKRIMTLKKSLRSLILQNYKTIMPNDNVSDLEINDDFEIALKDAKNGVINVISQSSGQKQILSIAIFWALSELSNSKMPLIIDTPLSRIDRDNRLRIIKHYYAKAQNQVIILPTDTEISPQEYNYIKPHLAQIYRINNTQDREHANISVANITDIFED